ncbi:MAG: outer membrane lipoprotein carrier protein LolA [Pseudomonadota bacterium]
MSRRLFTTGLLATGLSRPAFAADKLSLGAISGYLNELTTVQGAFTQINDDGTIATGQISIHRPGRVRFEYDPPEPALVMAGGGQVAIFDPKSNQRPEQYPLRRTPLNLILKRNVNLAQENMVIGHGFDGTATTVTAQDPENPELGNIALKFTGPPVQLRQWVITNQDGSQSTVILGDVKFGVRIGAGQFNIVREIERRGL